MRQVPKVKNRQGVIGFGLAALLMLAFPGAAIGAQYQKLQSGTSLRLNVTGFKLDTNGFVPKLTVTTPLNKISTTHMTGDNNFVENDPVFVFMSPGPHDIWYPYAISKRPPKTKCRSPECLIIKGIVTDIARDSLKVRYAFETMVIPPQFHLEEVSSVHGEIDIQVDRAGHSTLRASRLGNQNLDQRNLLIWAPPGSSNLGANKAPAIKPPK